ncbi:MAG TPA: protein phosphatase 2C domain-containing protein [Pyrinomonadaceae bacterium]
MNADSTFHIGSSHAICQDYSLAGVSPPAVRSEEFDPPLSTPYVILSDGCSSSPDTDVGARLLVKAAEQVMRECGRPSARNPAEIHTEAARRALTWAELLRLPPQAVDATLLTAHLDGEELIIGCSGDGVICLETRAGAIDVYSISYASGYPLYPAYAHQPGRLLAMKDAGRDIKEVKHFHSASVAERLRPWGASGGDSPTEVFAIRAQDYKYAALISDGVHSFFRAARTGVGGGGEAILLEEVLPGLVSFKSTRGAFVGRRMKRFMKDCQDRGWQHADDLAVGALHLGG